MPKYKPFTEKIKAKEMSKVYIDSGLNQHETARRLYTSEQNINKKVNRMPVQQAISEQLDKAGLTDDQLTKEHFHVLTSPNPKLKLQAIELGYRVKGYIKTNGSHGNGTRLTSIIINDPSGHIRRLRDDYPVLPAENPASIPGQSSEV